mgnify:CR=1 FL=1
MTKAAKQFGARLGNFLASAETKQYLEALPLNSEFDRYQARQREPSQRWRLGSYSKLAAFYKRK